MAIAVTLTLTNVFQFISFLTPLLIVFFVLMLSIINNNIMKGLIFNMGVIIVASITYFLKNILKSRQSEYASPFCNVLPGPFTVLAGDGIFNSPSTSTSIIGFAISYIIFPMMVNNQMNPMLLTFLVAALGINGAVEMQNKCTSIGGIVLGALVGILFGIIYYTLLVGSGNKDMAFFAESISSNNTTCSKPGKKRFKCVTYSRSSVPTP